MKQNEEEPFVPEIFKSPIFIDGSFNGHYLSGKERRKKEKDSVNRKDEPSIPAGTCDKCGYKYFNDATENCPTCGQSVKTPK